eukprot:NODE_2316_length_945_cov_79.805804_g1906_i0.p1 GENE.NODE_2316_length_945_cov_79.805804_g1906_i0~~NODE_2316_length_945_cov_79.805804_g1906_i0.p1  ORF type:complete len:162 (+),score=36.64 NODE_2316_length_945_cov_79.805804_g1906_i0:336-821(+)
MPHGSPERATALARVGALEKLRDLLGQGARILPSQAAAAGMRVRQVNIILVRKELTNSLKGLGLMLPGVTVCTVVATPAPSEAEEGFSSLPRRMGLGFTSQMPPPPPLPPVPTMSTPSRQALPGTPRQRRVFTDAPDAETGPSVPVAAQVPRDPKRPRFTE